MRKIDRICLFIIVTLVATSCASTKKVAYFQDLDGGKDVTLSPESVITVGVSDKLSIVVNSKDPALAAIFNLPVISHQIGTVDFVGLGTSNYNQVSTYTVDTEGCIDFPILGKIRIEGLRRDEIASKIKQMILDQNLIKDPVVTVDFANLYITVLGDVAHPGRFIIDKDKITVVDAIAKAGDLAVTGLRGVKVFREEDGRQKCYEMDFTKASEVFSSPAYYLHQNDIVYVEQNKMKKRSSTVNGNTAVSVSFWVSVASLLTSIGTLLTTILVTSK